MSDLDILVLGVGKDVVMCYLVDYFVILLEWIVVVGDFGNDLVLFNVVGWVIVVGNVCDELVFVMLKEKIYYVIVCYVVGVMEGLIVIGVIFDLGLNV